MAVVRLVWRQTRRRLLSIRAAVWSWSTLLVVAQCSVGLLCGALLVHHLGSFDIIKDRELREQFTSSSSSSPEQQAQLLLVGVMTAQQFLGGRALEAWRTWAQRIPGAVVFFVGDNTVVSDEVRQSGMPIYRLRGVDDRVYPPQKKSFAMLHWMHINHLDKFGWFMRADDDVYVRPERLRKFLQSLDPNRPLYLGQAGLGNRDEYGRLALGPDENYCMGGPGVVLSRAALGLVGPHLRECLGRILEKMMMQFLAHEDVELGRCIHQYAGVSCPWNYEMKRLFHNNLTLSPGGTVDHQDRDSSSSSGQQSQQKLAENEAATFRHAITLHPVKSVAAMRRVHVASEQLRLVEMRDHWVDMALDLDTESSSTPENTSSRKKNPLVVVVEEQQQQGQPHWEFLGPEVKTVFCAGRNNCPRHATDPDTRTAVEGIVAKVMDEFNGDAQARGRDFRFQQVRYAYRRVALGVAVDYVLDLALVYRRFTGGSSRDPKKTTMKTVPVRRHVYVRQHFGPPVVLTDREQLLLLLKQRSSKNNNSDEDNPSVHPLLDEKARLQQVIHIVVPLRGRLATFYRFARNLETVVDEGETNLRLVIVLYPSDSPMEDQQLLAVIAELAQLLPTDIVHPPEEEAEEFSRGRALSHGAARLPAEALLFFVDIDVVIDRPAFRRIRLNTIIGTQVFFPVVFSEFNPRTWMGMGSSRRQRNSDKQAPKTPQAAEDEQLDSAGGGQTTGPADGRGQQYDPARYAARRGYFRTFGYGIVAVYRRDFDAVGGFDLSIRGWGLEDVDFFDRCLNASAWGLRVFRAIEPGLIHVYHPAECHQQFSPADDSKLAGVSIAVNGSSANIAERANQMWKRQQRQLSMCQGTRAQNFASRDWLAEQLMARVSGPHRR